MALPSAGATVKMTMLEEASYDQSEDTSPSTVTVIVSSIGVSESAKPS